MAFEGYVDVVNDREIAGWIWDDARPDEALTLEILAGDRVLATIVADMFREDLRAHRKGNGRHAFHHRFPEAAGSTLSARIPGKRWRLQPTQVATGQPPPLEHDRRRRFLHTLEFGYPDVPTAFSDAKPSPAEAQIVERIIAATHLALNEDPAAKERKTDIWSEIHEGAHGPLLKLIRKRDTRGLVNYLRDAHAQGITLGITQGAEMTQKLRTQFESRRVIATEYIDNLASLAEFLAILDVESPEQRGAWGENIHADPQQLVDHISATVGFPIPTPPAIGSYFGIPTRDGIVTGRDLCALYAALQLRALAGELGLHGPTICEIGGGLGGVAYYCAKLGFEHTIIDLPLVNTLQAYFLMRALPEVKLQLYGEPDDPATRIRVLPTFCFSRPQARFDILFNQDSLPEMNEAYALGYLKQASSNIGYAFYSINQEARAPQSGGLFQPTVPSLVQRVGGFRRVRRYRHWLKAGYVEEVYRTAGQ